MLNKVVAICLLFFFIAIKSTVIFNHVSDQSLVTWFDQEGEEGDQQEENKEPKQLEKEFDEFFQTEQLYTIYLPSMKLHPWTSESPITEYLSSPDLPPEGML